MCPAIRFCIFQRILTKLGGIIIIHWTFCVHATRVRANRAHMCVFAYLWTEYLQESRENTPKLHGLLTCYVHSPRARASTHMLSTHTHMYASLSFDDFTPNLVGTYYRSPRTACATYFLCSPLRVSAWAVCAHMLQYMGVTQYRSSEVTRAFKCVNPCVNQYTFEHHSHMIFKAPDGQWLVFVLKFIPQVCNLCCIVKWSHQNSSSNARTLTRTYIAWCTNIHMWVLRTHALCPHMYINTYLVQLLVISRTLRENRSNGARTHMCVHICTLRALEHYIAHTTCGE
jgi:hypothetical protein